MRKLQNVTFGTGKWGDDPFPGMIEREFRLLLGKHNQHLNTLELCIDHFSDKLSTSSHPGTYLRDLAKTKGRHSLYTTGIAFPEVHRYLTSSHIAYLFSAGDAACRKIRDNSLIKKLKTEKQSLANELDKGDFIRKTLKFALWASLPEKQKTKDFIISKADSIILTCEFQILN